MRGDERGVELARFGGNARQIGVVIEVDVIETEIAVIVERQTPFPIRGDAPTQIRFYR